MPPPPSDDVSVSATVRSPAWLDVRIGLGWYFVGVVIFGLGMCGMLLLVLLKYGDADRAISRGYSASNANAEWSFFLVACAICVGISLLLQAIGQCMCWTIPAETGCRPLVIGALVFSLFFVAFACCSNPLVNLQGISPHERGPGRIDRGDPEDGLSGLLLAREGLNVFAMGFGLVAYIGRVMFVCFLSATARYLGNNRLVRLTQGFLIFEVGMIGMLMTLVFVLNPLGLASSSAGVAILLPLVLFAVLISSVWLSIQIALLRGTIEAVRQRDRHDFRLDRFAD